MRGLFAFLIIGGANRDAVRGVDDFARSGIEERVTGEFTNLLGGDARDAGRSGRG